MEKIQAAIAKAREARSSPEPMPRDLALRADKAGPDTVYTSPLPKSDAQTDQKADLWAQMSPYTPDPARLEQMRVLTLKGGHTATVFDQMRTKILQTMRSNRWKRLAITSPSPACGKSTLALNLGFSFARQAELRTVLAELDLRRPSLAEMLRAKPAHSIEDVLRGKLPLHEQALCFNGNLALSLCTKPVPNSAELLQTAGAAAQISAAEEALVPDVMIFDMPPMLLSDDVMSFAAQVDCVLLIAAAESTTVKEIDACERELASQTNVMGVVLNKCLHTMSEPGYGYGYGYGEY